MTFGKAICEYVFAFSNKNTKELFDNCILRVQMDHLMAVYWYLICIKTAAIELACIVQNMTCIFCDMLERAVLRKKTFIVLLTCPWYKAFPIKLSAHRQKKMDSPAPKRFGLGCGTKHKMLKIVFKWTLHLLTIAIIAALLLWHSIIVCLTNLCWIMFLTESMKNVRPFQIAAQKSCTKNCFKELCCFVAKTLNGNGTQL